MTEDKREDDFSVWENGLNKLNKRLLELKEEIKKVQEKYDNYPLWYTMEE